MSSIENYEQLKRQGSWKDRIDYILSLPDKTEIEIYLKKSALTSYDDLQTLVFLSKSTKNQKHLIEIFKIDSLPVRQRVEAAKAWLQLEIDEKQIHQFVIEAITAANTPRLIKHQILKHLHHIPCLKTSSSFFYNLACQLTESLHHDEFNIDGHTLPFCSSDQILDLLSRWSLTRYSQICFSSSFCSKLVRYQPLIVIRLIQGELQDKYIDYYELWNYCRKNSQLLELLARREPKAMCRFAIEYVNRLEKHKKILPAFIQSEEKRLFEKAPDEMIELISLVASHQPGIIKYESTWDLSGMELSNFQFPRSFSIDHYVRLFLVLYETCQWSMNNISSILYYMLSCKSSLHQQRKWFFDHIVQGRIGREEFLNKLLKNGTENQLYLLSNFPELSVPLARHLLSQLNQSKVISTYQRASFLCYELMASDVFDQFLSLFQQAGSDVNDRKLIYTLIFQCAVSTDRQSVKRVLQWIEKRFTNEQLIVIENFLRNLSSCDNRFQLEYLPENFETIERIIDRAFNHIQRTSTTLEIILAYGLFLLNRAENSQEQIQEFACKIIKQYYLTDVTFPYDYVLLPKARHLLANLLVSDIFPKLISRYLVTEINNFLMNCFHNAWRLPEIDSFLHSFFFEHLSGSTNLQSAFNIDEHSFLISLLLKQRSTRLERVHRLLNEIDLIFFLHIDVQRAVLYSRQDRSLIDQLLKNEKCLNADRLAKEQTNFSSNKRIPGFAIAILNHCYHQLTGQQQEHITNIILNDHLPDLEISNLEKLKALRVLRRLTHTYQNTLQWIEQKRGSFLSVSSDTPSLNTKSIRGANIQTINHYVLPLPATFDLVPQDLFKQFDRLIVQLSASNAIYVTDALFCISRKVNDQKFLERYTEFIRNEHFSKLGITANKAILRLLIQYRFNSNLIQSILKPLWDSRPHPDIRACLIMILLQFLHDPNLNNDQSAVWSILEEAAHDDYHPVIYALFGANGKGIRQTSRQIKESSTNVLQLFVKRIQMKILDHPTSVTALSWAWSLLDSDYCEINLVIDKARELCIRFDKDANFLWKGAFEKILAFYKRKKITANDIVDFIQKIMNHRKELDSNEDAIHDQNDLPVYRRINNLLEMLITSIDEIDLQQRLCFRAFALSILQFEITMAVVVGKFLMKLAQSKEDLDNILTIFQQNLPTDYFEHVVIQLASSLTANDGSCPFIQQLNIEEKFQLVLWFINERNQALFVFDLLKNGIFNKTSVDREQCQTLLRQMRKSENLLLRQKALEYKVPWRKDGTINDDNT